MAGISYTNAIPNLSTGLPTIDPFLWTKDRGMIDLGTLGGTIGAANALNNRGQVIGSSNLAGDQTPPHPFLWDDGKLIDLFTETVGANPVTANAMNDAGEIVGQALFSNEFHHAYLWRDGVATDLGTLPGDSSSEAFAINARGQVVGRSAACDSSTRSFLWENGSIVDLNSFVPPGSGLQLVDAQSINDHGEIEATSYRPVARGTLRVETICAGTRSCYFHVMRNRKTKRGARKTLKVLSSRFTTALGWLKRVRPASRHCTDI